MRFTYHSSHTFKEYNEVFFSLLTAGATTLEHFFHPKKKLCTISHFPVTSDFLSTPSKF